MLTICAVVSLSLFKNVHILGTRAVIPAPHILGTRAVIPAPPQEQPPPTDNSTIEPLIMTMTGTGTTCYMSSATCPIVLLALCVCAHYVVSTAASVHRLRVVHPTVGRHDHR